MIIKTSEKAKKLKKIKSEAAKVKVFKKIVRQGMSSRQREDLSRKFLPPKWWDCGWRRNPCGASNCPICSREMSRQIINTMRGKDPDDLGVVFEDLANDLLEIKKIIKEDAKKLGIDVKKIEVVEMPKIREPEEFPIFKEVDRWRKKVYDILDSLHFTGDLWVYTEEAADLAWYSNTFFAKIARQLETKAEIEAGMDFVDVDYGYTKEVLKECSRILNRSLESLYADKKFSRKDLNLLGEELKKLEEKALNI